MSGITIIIVTMITIALISRIVAIDSETEKPTFKILFDAAIYIFVYIPMLSSVYTINPIFLNYMLAAMVISSLVSISCEIWLYNSFMLYHVLDRIFNIHKCTICMGITPKDTIQYFYTASHCFNFFREHMYPIVSTLNHILEIIFLITIAVILYGLHNFIQYIDLSLK